MKNSINKYIVSSANWELVVDHELPESAAVSALLMALGKFGDNLLLSTTIMVVPEESYINDSLIGADFFATRIILSRLGLNKLSKSFQEFEELQSI